MYEISSRGSSVSSRKLATLGGIILALSSISAQAAGVSAYLPLNLEPEIERQIERVLILADEPILKRPFAVALVELALPKACEADKVLCTRVKRYLERYSRDYALTHASVTGSIAHGADDVVANNHGLPVQSKWEVSAQGFVQPNDYMLASAGVIAYEGRTRPTGSMLSFGFNWAQLDIGYRDHWFSPATDSSMMIGTESPTMPSVTLSNYEPFTRLGFQYEFFLAQMARSDHRTVERQSETVRRAAFHRALQRMVARRQPAAAIRRRRATGFRALSGAGFFQAGRPIADSRKSRGLVRQSLHLSRQDTVRRVLSIRR